MKGDYFDVPVTSRAAQSELERQRARRNRTGGGETAEGDDRGVTSGEPTPSGEAPRGRGASPGNEA